MHETQMVSVEHLALCPVAGQILQGLILRLTRLAYPSGDALEHKGLQVLLRQLEQQMEEAVLNRSIQFPEKEDEP